MQAIHRILIGKNYIRSKLKWMFSIFSHLGFSIAMQNCSKLIEKLLEIEASFKLNVCPYQIPHGWPLRIIKQRREWFEGFQSCEVSLLTRFRSLLLRPHHTVVIIESSLVMMWRRYGPFGYRFVLEVVMIVKNLENIFIGIYNFDDKFKISL